MATDNKIPYLGQAGTEQLVATVKDLLDNKLDKDTLTTLTSGETISLSNGVLKVNTTNVAEQDNTLPITSAGVYTQIGNIEALLNTI